MLSSFDLIVSTWLDVGSRGRYRGDGANSKTSDANNLVESLWEIFLFAVM